jgi:prolipoprotein diacylglyceryltransferase
VILFLERRFSLRWGKVWALYLIWYGLGRSWLETIRIDPTTEVFLGIPANDWASFVAVALGIGLFIVQTRRHPEPELSIFSTGRQEIMRPAALAARTGS